jgi:hypothetical protein
MKCEICDREFANSEALKLHTSAVHKVSDMYGR